LNGSIAVAGKKADAFDRRKDPRPMLDESQRDQRLRGSYFDAFARVLWVGIRPASPDGIPHVAKLIGCESFLLIHTCVPMSCAVKRATGVDQRR
jgi:hypothetical protein